MDPGFRFMKWLRGLFVFLHFSTIHHSYLNYQNYIDICILMYFVKRIFSQLPCCLVSSPYEYTILIDLCVLVCVVDIMSYLGCIIHK